MNLLDLGIIILLGLITVRGFFRGLFQELAVLVGVVGGVVVAAHTYLRLAGWLQPWITDPHHARWIAFAVVFVAVTGSPGWRPILSSACSTISTWILLTASWAGFLPWRKGPSWWDSPCCWWGRCCPGTPSY